MTEAVPIRCGGTGAVHPASEDTQQLIEKVKEDVEKTVGHSLETYQAISFISQVVAGVNYFVKVNIGNDKYVHLRIYQRT